MEFNIKYSDYTLPTFSKLLWWPSLKWQGSAQRAVRMNKKAASTGAENSHTDESAWGCVVKQKEQGSWKKKNLGSNQPTGTSDIYELCECGQASWFFWVSVS